MALRLGLAGPDAGPSNDYGVWAGASASQLHLVAREGDPAPGTEPGTLFGDFAQAGATVEGRGVFFAYLAGNGLDPNRDRGIWAEGLDGILHRIARRGDSVQLPSGEVVQLTSVEFSPDFGIGGAGYVGFVSNLSNGQRGVFVSSIATIPEPASLLQACAAIIAGAWVMIGRRNTRSLLPAINRNRANVSGPFLNANGRT